MVPASVLPIASPYMLGQVLTISGIHIAGEGAALATARARVLRCRTGVALEGVAVTFSGSHWCGLFGLLVLCYGGKALPRFGVVFWWSFWSFATSIERAKGPTKDQGQTR